METEFNLVASVAKRFFRGFIAGAFSSMATMTIFATNLDDLAEVGAMLGISALIGGVTGGILAADKYLRSTPLE